MFDKDYEEDDYIEDEEVSDEEFFIEENIRYVSFEPVKEYTLNLIAKKWADKFSEKLETISFKNGLELDEIGHMIFIAFPARYNKNNGYYAIWERSINESCSVYSVFWNTNDFVFSQKDDLKEICNAYLEEICSTSRLEETVDNMIHHWHEIISLEEMMEK